MTRLVANWSYPTAVRFGAGRISEAAEACRAAGIARPLLVTDAGLAKLPITAQALSILKEGGVEAALFSDVKPNPIEANLEAGVNAFREGGHDGVVAFGGGSGLDMGKLVAFMCRQTRPVWDFEDIGDWWARAVISSFARPASVTSSGCKMPAARQASPNSAIRPAPKRMAVG